MARSGHYIYWKFATNMSYKCPSPAMAVLHIFLASCSRNASYKQYGPIFLRYFVYIFRTYLLTTPTFCVHLEATLVINKVYLLERHSKKNTRIWWCRSPRPLWFCDNFYSWGARDEAVLPVTNEKHVFPVLKRIWQRRQENRQICSQTDEQWADGNMII